MRNYDIISEVITLKYPPPFYVVKAAQVLLGQTTLNAASTEWQECAKEGGGHNVEMELRPQNADDVSAVIAMQRFLGSKGFWAGLVGGNKYIPDKTIDAMMMQIHNKEAVTPIKITLDPSALTTVQKQVANQLDANLKKLDPSFQEERQLLHSVVTAPRGTIVPSFNQMPRSWNSPEENPEHLSDSWLKSGRRFLLRRSDVVGSIYPPLHSDTIKAMQIIMGQERLNAESSLWEQGEERSTMRLSVSRGNKPIVHEMEKLLKTVIIPSPQRQLRPLDPAFRIAAGETENLTLHLSSRELEEARRRVIDLANNRLRTDIAQDPVGSAVLMAIGSGRGRARNA